MLLFLDGVVQSAVADPGNAGLDEGAGLEVEVEGARAAALVVQDRRHSREFGGFGGEGRVL